MLWVVLGFDFASIINEWMKEVADDPIHACCSCERLFKQSQVTAFKIDGPKWVSEIWQVLFVYMLGCEKTGRATYVCG